MTAMLLAGTLAFAAEPPEETGDYAKGHADGVGWWDGYGFWQSGDAKDGSKPLRVPYLTGLGAGALCSGVGCLVNGVVWYYAPTPMPEELGLDGSADYVAGWEAGYHEAGRKKRYRMALIGGAVGTVITGGLIIAVY
jgi:hypothetical protein